jgi:hypothetical protein
MSRLLESAEEPARSEAALDNLSDADGMMNGEDEDEDGDNNGAEGEEEEEERHHRRRRSARRWVMEPLEAEVACVAAVLKVDHRVVNERVREVLGMLARRYHVLGSRATGHHHQVVLRCRHRCVTLVGDVAETYGKLRQVQALLEALLQAGDQQQQAEAVEALLKRKDCQGSLARVIRECPSPLLSPLFEALRTPLLAEGEGHYHHHAVGVVVRLLVVFLANVKISATNAKDLRDKAVRTLQQVLPYVRTYYR